MIHLQYVRLQFPVHQNVEAEYLEAGLYGIVARKAGMVVVLKHRPRAQHGLDDDVVHIRPELAHVIVVPGHPIVNGAQLAFAAAIVIVTQIVLGVAFVHRVVGQMHVQIVGIARSGLHIFVSGKPCQALIVDVKP